MRLGERLDELADAVGDAEHGADGDVDGGFGDDLSLVLLGFGDLLGAGFGLLGARFDFGGAGLGRRPLVAGFGLRL